MPEDEELSLQESCYYGDQQNILGYSSEKIPKEYWDNRTLQIITDGYIIDYRIRPFGATTAQGTYEYLNYAINSPYNLLVRLPKDDAQNPVIYWDWDGNLNDITGFTLYVNGKPASQNIFNTPITQSSPFLDNKSLQAHLPTSCGAIYQFQVAANANHARSMLSEAIQYKQPPCPIYAEVQFFTAQSSTTDDQSCYFPIISTCYSYKRCDELSIYYELYATGIAGQPAFIKVGNDQYHFSYKCGIEYSFTQQLGATHNIAIVAIDPLDPVVRVGSTFWESDVVNDDTFGRTAKDFSYPYTDWVNVDEDFTLTAGVMGDTADMTITGHIRGFQP